MKTYKTWIRKDDNDIPLFSQNTGGRPRKTTAEEDQLIATVALENRFKPLCEWRDDPRLAGNETIFHMSDRLIYLRLNKLGKFDMLEFNF